MKRKMQIALAVAVLGLGACAHQASTHKHTPTKTDEAAAAFWASFDAALDGAHRDPGNAARNVWRHPKETLQFFGFGPGQNVVEITPGGGWYTELLAPTLRERGALTVAIIDPATTTSERAKAYYEKNNQSFRDKLNAKPELYDQAKVVAFSSTAPVFGDAGSADLVLTFRNVHNWTNAGTEAAMFKGFFDVLKPGGVLGVVEHRAKPEASLEDMKKSGYLTESHVKQLAAAAGFELAGESAINNNPKDTKDHPGGVWSLPPVLHGDEVDREKFLAIGESDRMTLKFVKPTK